MQTAGIDLPQKALIWEDKNGQVWFTYNDPQYVATRHDAKGSEENVKKTAVVLAGFAAAATRP